MSNARPTMRTNGQQIRLQRLGVFSNGCGRDAIAQNGFKSRVRLAELFRDFFDPIFDGRSYLFPLLLDSLVLRIAGQESRKRPMRDMDQLNNAIGGKPGCKS